MPWATAMTMMTMMMTAKPQRGANAKDVNPIPPPPKDNPVTKETAKMTAKTSTKMIATMPPGDCKLRGRGGGDGQYGCGGG